MMLLSESATVFCPHCGTVLMDMTHPGMGLPISPRPRKRLWLFLLFFILPVFFVVFFGLLLATPHIRPVRPMEFEFQDFPVPQEMAFPPEQLIELEKSQGFVPSGYSAPQRRGNPPFVAVPSVPVPIYDRPLPESMIRQPMPVAPRRSETNPR
jgi:hypothetical protein